MIEVWDTAGSASKEGIVSELVFLRIWFITLALQPDLQTDESGTSLSELRNHDVHHPPSEAERAELE